MNDGGRLTSYYALLPANLLETLLLFVPSVKHAKVHYDKSVPFLYSLPLFRKERREQVQGYPSLGKSWAV